MSLTASEAGRRGASSCLHLGRYSGPSGLERPDTGEASAAGARGQAS